jgi:hypothetical protein
MDASSPSAEPLQHYLYMLLSLEFRKSHVEATDKPDTVANRKESADSYMNLMRNVYLRSLPRQGTVAERGFFLGRSDAAGYKLVNFFERDDPVGDGSSFVSQISDTGNCTVHNLKKSLQNALDMDEIMFGLLEDTLLMGLDQFITEKYPQAPASQ